jgi:hypothetical protein
VLRIFTQRQPPDVHEQWKMWPRAPSPVVKHHDGAARTLQTSPSAVQLPLGRPPYERAPSGVCALQ